MTAQAWPADPTEVVSFDKLVTPIADAVRFCFDMERKNRDEDVPYTGMEKAHVSLVTSFPADEALTAEQLRYDDEDQGRDALHVIIGIAISVGMEQGIRHARSRNGGGHRTEYQVSAAIEEANAHLGDSRLDDAHLSMLSGGVRITLDDAMNLKALEKRHEDRVTAYLAEAREARDV